MELGRKMALKGRPVEVLGAPTGLTLDLEVGRGPDSALLVFVTDRASLVKRIEPIVRSASTDRLTWVAYPKAGQLGTDINRDSLAELVMSKGVRAVTQVSIDDVWSALRFRPGRTP